MNNLAKPKPTFESLKKNSFKKKRL